MSNLLRLNPRNTHSLKMTFACLLASLWMSTALAQSAAPQADSSFSGGNRWVATWTTAPINPGPTTIDAIFQNDHSRSFENQTVRNIAHVSVGGRFPDDDSISITIVVRLRCGNGCGLSGRAWLGFRRLSGGRSREERN